MLEAEEARPEPEVPDTEIFTKIDCPVLVIHGTKDRIQPHLAGEEAARLSQGTLVSMTGSGHMPNVRDPVKVNLVLRDFVERLGR
jgi:pimeloyl-ACP methyl ester carboxylesterase